ncbi:MAG: hypothetical protein WCG44_03635 [bacterium]
MKAFASKLIISLCLFAFSFSLFSSQVHASSLIVSPPRVDLEGKPGDVLQQTIKVTNSSDKSVTLSALVSDFIVEDNSGTPIRINSNASGRYLASPWFVLDRPEFTLAAGQSTSVIAIIELPKDALPGGHYAGVFFSPIEKGKLDTTGATVVSQVGSLFGITVAGNLKYDAIIKEFSVKSAVSEFGPIEFSSVIENQSDTHIRPLSKIVIHDMIGRNLAEIKLDDVNIFPFTSRSIAGTWDNVWGLGRYTATLEATYGPGLVASRVLYFWIMPYRLIAAILVILMVILVLFISIRRHLKHREDHRDEEIDTLKRKIVEMENRHN